MKGFCRDVTSDSSLKLSTNFPSHTSGTDVFVSPA